MASGVWLGVAPVMFHSGTLMAQNLPPVPPQFQDLYASMNSQINALQVQIPAGNFPTIFSGELMGANAARGSALLSTSYSSVIAELNSLQTLGVQAVKVGIHFPILYPDYYQQQSDYQAYLDYYQQVVRDIRARGLKVIAETGLILNEPGLSNVDYSSYYNSLSLDQYEQGRMQQAVTIAQLIQPDYLSVLNEPDIEALQSGKPQLGTVTGSTGMLGIILNGILSAGATNVKIGAGVGTWLPSYDTFIRSYVTMPLQYIDMHVLPINDDYLARAFKIASIAQTAGLTVAVSQCWPLKERDSELSYMTFPQVEVRDPFSFWQPVDTSFLQTMVNFARSQKMAFFNPFYTTYFHAYLDYGSYGTLPTDQLEAALSAQVSQNVTAGIYTFTAQAYSAMILSQPDTNAPSVPTGLAAAGTTTSTTHITWTASTDDVGVAGYNVYRNGNLLGSTAAPGYFDLNLTPSTTYNYSVAAYDVAGNTSPQAGPASATTLPTPDTAPPTTPSGLAAGSVTSSQLVLSWAPATDNTGVSGYLIYRGPVPGSLSMYAGSATNSYTDIQVSPQITYYYAVLAYDATGNKSPLSNPIAVTTPIEPPPTVPSGFAGQASAYNQVNLSWNLSTSPTGVSGYKVYKGSSPTALTLIAATPLVSYTDTKVSPSTTYYYAVAAYDTFGVTSAMSGASVVVTPQEPNPAVPAQVTAQAPAYNQVGLSWTPVTGPVAISGYLVYKGTSASNMVLLASTAATSFVDSKVAPNVAYYYSVQAYDIYGLRSAQSGAVAVTTPQEPAPSVPAGLTAQAASYSQINLSWRASTSVLSVGGYLIYRGSSPSALSMLAASPTASYVDAKASPSTTYYYAVLAYDSYGIRSALSGSVSAATPQEPPPSAPTGLVGQMTSSGQMSLSWTAAASSSGIGGYIIYRGTTPSGLYARANSPGTGTSYTDGGLTPGVTYYYAVVAYDPYSLKSNLSAAISVSPGPTSSQPH
jgi:fibronectin type 3 domain-containing protein